MIPVRFYKSFSKRKNSTKQPAVSDAYDEINVVLKEDTTVETPSLVLTQRVDSASGNPVTVDASAGNMINPVVTFNPVQTGTGTPSPSNPRPIVAYTSINVDVNGNVFSKIISAVGGGIYNAATGLLTVTHGFINLGSSDISWVYSNTNKRFYTYDIPVIATANSTATNAKMAEYEPLSWNAVSADTTIDYKICVNNAGVFGIRNLSCTDVNALQSALNNVYLIFEYATPFVVDVGNLIVALYNGANTISVNGNSSIAFNYVKEQIELDYVYAYIPDFDKYYFCSSPTILTNYHVQYDLVEDYLASRKTEVGSTVAHIAFSSSGYNKYIPDTRMCVRSDKVYQNAASAASGLSSIGAYVLSVINDKSNGLNGAATYYVMSTGDLAKLTKNLLDASVLTQIKNIFDNPMDSIVSCTWIPVSPSDMTGHIGTGEFVHLGNEELDGGGDPAMACAGSPITDPLLSLSTVSLTIPYKWNDFRDGQPYTSFSLYLPGVGETDLNASDFIESATVSVYPRVDLTTGDIIYWVYDDNGVVLKTVAFSGGCDVPLAHITTNAKGALATIGGSVGGLAASALGTITGNAPLTVGGGLALLGAAGSTAMQFNTRSTSVKGSTNGRSAFADTQFKLTVVSQETEDCDDASYIARIGRPVGVTHAISNHSGYVQCEAASVAIAGDNTEREIINNYLNTGFYYE